VAYGFAFVVAAPGLLVAWAVALEKRVALPVPDGVAIGWAGAALGAALIGGGWIALWRQGGGLPMNAFPPPRLVQTGVFRWLRHPVYVGFLLLCAGLSLVVHSAPGLWVVTPVAALGAAALVLGYEGPALRRRFGETAGFPVRLGLPPPTDESPDWLQRLWALVSVLGLWLLGYEAVRAAGPAASSVVGYLPFERSWVVWDWTWWIYGSAYLVVPLLPLVAPSRRALREWVLCALIATGVGILLLFTLPVVAPSRHGAAVTLAGRLLAWEQAREGNGTGACPAFHVVWAVVAAGFVARWWPRRRSPAWLWCALVTASCVTTGMHALVDLSVGGLLGAGALHWRRAWAGVRRWFERLGNSWQAWRIGPVRVINHSVYPALGGFLAVYLAGLFAGESAQKFVAGVGFAAVLGAGLWAQLIEGASGLSRPFGYYGSLLGGGLALAVGGLLGAPAWTVLAGFAMGAPWVQAMGRLRCVVQGCCHGAPCAAALGLRIVKPESRIVRLAKLGGVPVHPTPVYSIGANLVLGLLLLRLWQAGSPPGVLAGVYLLLGGLARFVEEAYRGEPQTPEIAGLRLYQWMAIASVLTGGGLMVTGPATPLGASVPGATWVVFSIAFGAVCGFAMGVDSPASNRRFSRLA